MDTPCRETEVSREKSILSASLGSAKDKILQLRERLKPILANKPSDVCGVPEKEVAICPLATEIRDMSRKVDDICGIISIILQEIEL